MHTLPCVQKAAEEIDKLLQHCWWHVPFIKHLHDLKAVNHTVQDPDICTVSHAYYLEQLLKRMAQSAHKQFFVVRQPMRFQNQDMDSQMHACMHVGTETETVSTMLVHVRIQNWVKTHNGYLALAGIPEHNF